MPPGTQIDKTTCFPFRKVGGFSLVEAPAPSPVRTVIVLGNTEKSVAARL